MACEPQNNIYELGHMTCFLNFFHWMKNFAGFWRICCTSNIPTRPAQCALRIIKNDCTLSSLIPMAEWPLNSIHKWLTSCVGSKRFQICMFRYLHWKKYRSEFTVNCSLPHLSQIDIIHNIIWKIVDVFKLHWAQIQK